MDEMGVLWGSSSIMAVFEDEGAIMRGSSSELRVFEDEVSDRTQKKPDAISAGQLVLMERVLFRL